MSEDGIMGALKQQHLDDHEEIPYDPSKDSYCQDGDKWVEETQKADKDYQMEVRNEEYSNSTS
jgi:hypothetical protein